MKKLLALLALAMLLPTTAVRGETLAALTATNQLIRFNSASPGTVAGSVAVTGLSAGDALVGIDVRPANNLLYGFAINRGAGGASPVVGRVYSINLTTGAATLASTLAPDGADNVAPFPFSAVSGDFFGIDFNPVADRLRVVSDTGQSLRINVATGLTQLDVSLAYAAAPEPNAGTPPAAVASAYTNSVAGAATTVLYNLDASISNLVRQDPPNNGTLNSLGLLSSIVFPDASFDISGKTGVGYVTLDGATLQSINLTNGVLTDLGPVGSQAAITALAVVVPEPATIALVITACAMCANRRRRAARISA